MSRRYYAVAEIPHSNLSALDSLCLRAFPSRSLRDGWVDSYGADFEQALLVSGEERRAVSHSEAVSILRQIDPGSPAHMVREIPLS